MIQMAFPKQEYGDNFTKKAVEISKLSNTDEYIKYFKAFPNSNE